MHPAVPRVVLVTGTSRGIGAAIAAAFSQEGDVVVGCGRSAAPDEPANGTHYRTCDLRDPAAITGLVAGVVEEHGRLDVLVNNAAIEVDETVEQTTVEQWDETLAVNVRAPGLLAAAAIPHMRLAGGGAIVNIASIDALWAEPALPARDGAWIAVSTNPSLIPFAGGPLGEDFRLPADALASLRPGPVYLRAFARDGRVLDTGVWQRP